MTATSAPPPPRALASPARVAVVILAHDGRDDVLACLASLRAETAAGDAVLVVDNGSRDGTPAAVRAAHAWCEVVENGTNLGWADGNNAGIRRAVELGCEWIWLLNQDTRVEPGALAALRAAAAGGAAAVLQPLVVQEEDPRRVDHLGLEPCRWLGVRRAGHGTDARDVPDAPVPVFGASGAAAFVQTALLRRVGAFDGELFLLCEDAEWAFRARAAGAHALLVPAARVRHRGGVSGPPRSWRARVLRKRLLQRNTVALALAWWPPALLLLAAPLLVWRACVALALAPLLPRHRCWPLWRRYWRTRRAARAGLRAHDGDRWFR